MTENASVREPIVRPTWVDKNDGWVILRRRSTLGRTDLSDVLRSQLERSRARTAAVPSEFFAAP